MRRAAVALVVCLLGLTACLPGQGLLSDVTSSLPVLSPAIVQRVNAANIGYRLSRPATVSTDIQGPDGTRWQLYQDSRRPSAGSYQIVFDGTVSGPGPNERTVLPDGDYRFSIRAIDGTEIQQQSIALPVRGADSVRPQVDQLTLFPTTISPNYDARNDVTSVNYRLTKDATVQAFADQVQPDGSTPRVYRGARVKVSAGEQQSMWDGTVNSQPLPNGSYLFGIRAEDSAGNVTESSQPLAIVDRGTPDGKISFARVGPTQIVRGGQVCVDATVQNRGQTVLRTQGPDPLFVYNSTDSFSSILNHQFVEKAGYWRIGMDWAGSPDTHGAKYAYRWGFGHDLEPGGEVTVHGCVAVQNEQDRLNFFTALIQENVALHDVGAGMVLVQISK